MPTRKLAVTDSIVYGQGVTIKNGVVADRNVTIGDNSATDRILLESGDFLLLEDGTSKVLRDIPGLEEND